MSAWVLIIAIIHYNSVDIIRVPAFGTERDYQAAGAAWQAQANRRDSQQDVTAYRCERA